MKRGLKVLCSIIQDAEASTKKGGAEKQKGLSEND